MTDHANPEGESVLARLRALEKSAEPTPEQEREILVRRARELAKPPVKGAAAVTRILRFQLAGQPFSMEAGFVHAVLRNARVTRVPTVPLLEAILPWHGGVLPIVSVRELLGLSPGDDEGPVLIVGRGQAELGMRTEAAEEIAERDPDGLRTAPGAERESLVSGSWPDGTLHLSAEALLDDPRLFFSEESTR